MRGSPTRKSSKPSRWPGTRNTRTRTADAAARNTHDDSSRNRADAKRNGRSEPRGREAYSLQYVDRLSGETARCSGVSAVAVEAVMGNPRYIWSNLKNCEGEDFISACFVGSVPLRNT